MKRNPKETYKTYKLTIETDSKDSLIAALSLIQYQLIKGYSAGYLATITWHLEEKEL